MVDSNSVANERNNAKFGIDLLNDFSPMTFGTYRDTAKDKSIESTK